MHLDFPAVESWSESEFDIHSNHDTPSEVLASTNAQESILVCPE